MYYGSTLIEAMVMQESQTVWMDSSSSYSQSQPSVHTDLAWGISTLEDWLESQVHWGHPAKLSSAGTTSYSPSQFRTQSVATTDRPWQKLDTAYTHRLDFVVVMKMRESITFCAIYIFLYFNNIFITVKREYQFIQWLFIKLWGYVPGSGGVWGLPLNKTKDWSSGSLCSRRQNPSGI